MWTRRRYNQVQVTGWCTVYLSIEDQADQDWSLAVDMFASRKNFRTVANLTIEGHASLAVKQKSSLTQDKFTSRKNFHTITNLTEVSSFKMIKGDSESSADCDNEASRNKINMAATYPDDTFLDLFTTVDKNLMAAWLSEKIVMRVKGRPLVLQKFGSWRVMFRSNFPE